MVSLKPSFLLLRYPNNLQNVSTFTMKIWYAINKVMRYYIKKGTFSGYYSSELYSQAQAMRILA
jgi:hypothetical protein